MYMYTILIKTRQVKNNYLFHSYYLKGPPENQIAIETYRKKTGLVSLHLTTRMIRYSKVDEESSHSENLQKIFKHYSHAIML